MEGTVKKTMITMTNMRRIRPKIRGRQNTVKKGRRITVEVVETIVTVVVAG